MSQHRSWQDAAEHYRRYAHEPHERSSCGCWLALVVSAVVWAAIAVVVLLAVGQI